MLSTELKKEVYEHLPYLGISIEDTTTLEELLRQATMTVMTRKCGVNPAHLSRKGKKVIDKLVNDIDFNVRTDNTRAAATRHVALKERLRQKLEARKQEQTAEQ